MLENQSSSNDRPGQSGGGSPSLSKVVYRSRAVVPLSAPQLHQLATAAQARNRLEAVTGLMLYDDRRFFQWLEGPHDGVGRVMRSIRNDARHTDLEVLDEKPAERRMFGDWNMKLAARGPNHPSWRRDVLEPPPAIVADLRQRPEAAPTLLVKLQSGSVGGMAGDAAAPDQANAVPLSTGTASVLREVILSTVIPRLAKARGLARTHARSWVVSPRAAELAELLIAADQSAAREFIAEMRDEEDSVWPLYPQLFEPAARALGDLWSEDICSEHDVTLALQRLQTALRLLSTNAPTRAARPVLGPSVLIAPEPGELHRLGAALDSDVMWNAGWAPHCEYPKDDKGLQELLSTQWFDALDVSLSTAFRRDHWLPRVTKTIAAARRASRNPDLVVVVGGRVFVEQKSAGVTVGADMTSTTALNVDHLIMHGIGLLETPARTH